MEEFRRLLLFMALSIGLLIGWSWLNRPDPQPEQPPQKAVDKPDAKPDTKPDTKWNNEQVTKGDTK